MPISVGDIDHEVQIPENSLHSESQLDDDNVSENSFGSDFGDAEDEEGWMEITAAHSDMEPPPVYPNKEGPQFTTMLPNKDLMSPPIILQYIPPRPTETGLNTDPSMCVVCKLSPAYSKGGVSYPTCGLTCASKMPKVPISGPNFPCEPQVPAQYNGMPSSTSRSPGSASASQIQMCTVCHVRPRVQKAGKVYPTCGLTCASASTSSPSSKGNVLTLDRLISSYQKMALSDHSPHSPRQSSQEHRHNSRVQHGFHGPAQSLGGSTRTQTTTTGHHHRLGPRVHRLCIICSVKPCRDGRYVTCGMKCAETLCIQGSPNPTMCDYCHRRPKVAGYNQCSKTCSDNATTACLLCRCRPRFGRYHLCGRTCKKIATKLTPLILEVRPDHTTYHDVEQKFKRAWKGGTPCPPIKKIYKIIESKSFLQPYDRYKKRLGREVFRYHGTTRGCSLGSQGNTQVCSSAACALCSILRTSFKVSLARASGAFGAGIYTSSAANKAYSYSKGGAMLLTKVVLGTVYHVQAWNEVISCPPGHNSVVFNRQNGTLNETVVYIDDAIRPVFLIIL